LAPHMRRASHLATSARLDAEREACFAGAAPTIIPVVSDDPSVPCAMSGRDAWEFVQATLPFAPAWRNEVTLRSADFFQREFEPANWVARISPTPLLMIVATQDTRCPTDLALDAYNRALEPKRLLLLSGGHFDPYAGKQFHLTSIAASDWFVQHLLHDRL
jgi:hypothetical protein